MGDILHALPAVAALRIAHPEWEIDWVVEPMWKPLLAAEDSSGRDSENPSSKQPIVDRLHLAPTKNWRRNLFASQTRREIGALRKTLRAGKYDAVLDLQGAVRSAILGRMAGCRRFIGETEPRERIARWLFNERVATTGQHVIEQDLELAKAIAGDKLTYIQPPLPIDPAAESWANGLMDEYEGAPAALINPGAGWGAKRWPAERYADVARVLLDRGFRVLVNAGPGELSLPTPSCRKQAAARVRSCRRLSNSLPSPAAPPSPLPATPGPSIWLVLSAAPSSASTAPPIPAATALSALDSRYCEVLRVAATIRRNEAPEAGLLTISPEDVLQAADELLYPEAAP